MILLAAVLGWVIISQPDQPATKVGPFNIEECRQRAQELEDAYRESEAVHKWHKEFHAACEEIPE